MWVRRHLCVLALPLLAAAAPMAAADPRPAPTPAPAVEVARIPAPIRVDGHLDDEAWAFLQPFIDFVQRDPDEGMPATESTELLLAYDDEALYVGARLHDSDPELIEARLSRRDDHSESDRFAIYLDPRGDRRTGVRFEVTAAGVQRDEIIFNDTWTDRSWDALWESEVTVDDRGWSVEMRIPFSELRFLPGDSYAWGVNALRIIQRKNETDWLALVPSGETGLASRMAPLEGIEGVRPRAPLVLIPYAAAGTERGPVAAGDPFRDGSATHGSVGLDLRRKVGGSFALAATVNPDFGQVEVDPAVVNLSDSETFYPEKRPFFVQGRQTFDSFGSNGPNNHYGFERSEPDLFYTRRIGRPPQGESSGDYVLGPRFTTILGAAKFTGKTADGWSVGVLDAVTSSESAQWATGDDRGHQQVEPLTNYFVARAFRDSDRVGYGGIFTAVNRDLVDPELAGQLVRTAYVGGVDGYVFVDSRKDWVVGGRLAGSWVGGSREAIEDLQLASQRYFQRPDRAESRLDPARDALGGWTGNVNLNRQSGSVRVNAAMWATSPGFESNDLGFNRRSDRWGGHVAVQLRKSRPDGFTRYRSLMVAKAYSLNFDQEKQSDSLNVYARARFLNYWNMGLSGHFRWRSLADRATRGGPSMLSGQSAGGGFWLESDDRKPFVARVSGYHSANEWGSRYWNGEVAVEVHPTPALSIVLGPEVSRADTVAQWVTGVPDEALPETLGGHYVFAGFDQTELALAARLSWIFSPRLSLQVYTQPLVSRGSYGDFKELDRPRSFDFVAYGPGQIAYDPVTDSYTADPGRGSGPFSFGNPDFSFRSLRVNAVVRWEWRPGSAIYAVWAQQREDSASPGSSDLARDLDTLFAAPATDAFQVKATFRLGD
ncbi:MAG: carbohydrate binding family 9 domain-containing protein [Acidobacteria bacterium]|nr:carbohydrate binding family 9 domain-containing protein [Acidobacteriota bacterium]